MRSIFILAGCAMLVSGAAVADPVREDVLAGAARCEGIADNKTWLDCFYGSAQPMRALLGLAPAAAAQVKLVPPAGAAPPRRAPVDSASSSAPAPSQDRSFLSQLLGSTEPVVRDMPMESYSFASNRTFTVTLKNGESYQQEASDLVFAKWARPASSYRVTITPSGDKFTMKVKGQPGVSFQVRRK